MSHIRSHILVCTGTGCSSSDSPKIIAEFEKQLAEQGMDQEAKVDVYKRQAGSRYSRARPDPWDCGHDQSKENV